jgi:transposase
VLVANARRMHGSKRRRRRKNDRIDAAMLARLGRVDPKALYPIQHRSSEVREDLIVLHARELLVESRTKLISAVRGMVKTVGARLPGSSSAGFARKMAGEIPEQIRLTVEPLLDLIARLSEQINSYEKKIDQLAEEKYMHTKLLRQVTGVGPVTSLAYVLTLESLCDSRRAVMWVHMLAWCRSRRTRAIVSRNWVSVRPVTGCCANCW